MDRSLNSVNASISTNQASSLSLSKSSSSMDFELDDATQKISSASNRVSSLSSQSSKGDLDVSTGSTIPRIDESLADPFKTIQEFVSALDIDYTSNVDIELSDIRLAYRALEINGLLTGVRYKGETVIEKAEGEEAALDDQERAGKLALKLGSSESARDIDSIRAGILAQITQRFGPFDPDAPFPLADFIDANASLTSPISSSSSQSGTPQGGATIVQNSSQRTLLTPPASTGPPGGSGDSEK